ncbi:hypothetical protein PP707_06130 [Acetobacter pasteurianus]|nr:hypothetical protein [Acetobacter pasteurianus]
MSMGDGEFLPLDKLCHLLQITKTFVILTIKFIAYRQKIKPQFNNTNNTNNNNYHNNKLVKRQGETK